MVYGTAARSHREKWWAGPWGPGLKVARTIMGYFLV